MCRVVTTEKGAEHEAWQGLEYGAWRGREALPFAIVKGWHRGVKPFDKYFEMFLHFL